MTNETVGHFGVASIVFFRRHVTTREPLLEEPIVWTYNVGGADTARKDLACLRTKDHLFVPEGALTLSCHKWSK